MSPTPSRKAPRKLKPRKVHVTTDRLEEIAGQTGLTIDLGGRHPSLVKEHITYIGDLGGRRITGEGQR